MNRFKKVAAVVKFIGRTKGNSKESENKNEDCGLLEPSPQNKNAIASAARDTNSEEPTSHKVDKQERKPNSQKREDNKKSHRKHQSPLKLEEYEKSMETLPQKKRLVLRLDTDDIDTTSLRNQGYDVESPMRDHLNGRVSDHSDPDDLPAIHEEDEKSLDDESNRHNAADRRRNSKTLKHPQARDNLLQLPDHNGKSHFLSKRPGSESSMSQSEQDKAAESNNDSMRVKSDNDLEASSRHSQPNTSRINASGGETERKEGVKEAQNELKASSNNIDEESGDKGRPGDTAAQTEDGSHQNPEDNDPAYDEEMEHAALKYRQEARYANIKWTIFPDDDFRAIWDIVLTLNLIYTALVTPYIVAFIKDDMPIGLRVVDLTSDALFWLDIVINFLSAYFDKEENLITSKKQIAKSYLLGWFIPDIVSVFPFDQVVNISSNYNKIVRVARLPRLYRFLRLAKLARMFRLVKERNKLIRYLNEWFKLRAGIERFIFSILSIFIFCHIMACIWFLIAELNDEDNTWIVEMVINEKLSEDAGNFDKYSAAFYWVAQTCVTVGYGDIYPTNTLERTISMVLMLFGAFIYSLTVGSLSSLLSKMDSKNQAFQEKMDALMRIKQQYELDNIMYNRIRKALKYGLSKNDEDRNEFLNELPVHLRIELSVIMHKSVVSGIEFFKSKPPRFIAFIGPLLKPMKVGKNEYIFTEGESVVYFIKSGTVCIVLKEYNNFPFTTITPGYYFGEVDLLFSETRRHSYMADTECELLSISKKNFTKIFFYEFREIGSEIYNNALKRRVRNHKAYKDALSYCQTEAKEQENMFKNNKKGKKRFQPQNANSKINNTDFTRSFLDTQKEIENLEEVRRGSKINDDLMRLHRAGHQREESFRKTSVYMPTSGVKDEENFFLETQKGADADQKSLNADSSNSDSPAGSQEISQPVSQQSHKDEHDGEQQASSTNKVDQIKGVFDSVRENMLDNSPVFSGVRSVSGEMIKKKKRSKKTGKTTSGPLRPDKPSGLSDLRSASDVTSEPAQVKQLNSRIEFMESNLVKIFGIYEQLGLKPTKEGKNLPDQQHHK